MTRIPTTVFVLLFAVPFFLSAQQQALTSIDKIDADLRANRIDESSALALKASALFAPHELPADYQSSTPAKCGFPVVVELNEKLESLPEPDRQAVVFNLNQKPGSGMNEVFSPSGRFRIHFETVGPDAVDITDADQNGIPDYIDEVGIAFDFSYQREVIEMGYAEPPDFDTQFGNGFYDVFVSNINFYGQTDFLTTDLNPATPWFEMSSWITIDNDFAPGEGYFTTGLDAMRVTAAHEFHHAIQLGGYLSCESCWFSEIYYFELTATWLEDVVYDDVNDYYQYLVKYYSSSAGSHTTSFDESDGYSESVFGHYLEEKFGPDLMRTSWENLRDNELVLDALDAALAAAGSDFSTAFTEFTSWNFFTGSRASDSFYDEGADYPEIAHSATALFLNDASELNSVSSLASRFFVYDVTVPGKFTFDFGVSNLDNIDVNFVTFSNSGAVQTKTNRDQNSYEWIIGEAGKAGVVLVNTSRDFFESSVSFDVSFEGNTPAKNAVSFFPHPFQPKQQDRIYWQIDVSETATLEFEIFSSSGKHLISRRFPGTYAAGFYVGQGPSYPFFWDGRDAGGNRLPAGIYVYVFRINDDEKIGKIALIR